ncbi:hypothetical protein EDC96DRAFT_612369 [Choanephora cucurbitarum]|nr:hypothetical protein EDC96DRAFT_612369 [Choanephora cucurbitarum]
MSSNQISASSYINQYKDFISFVEHQAKIHSDKPCARYYAKDKSYKILTYGQINHIANILASQWKAQAIKTNVISYIGDHDVNYLIIMIALLKLRKPMMCISPRNSEAAITNLLQKTQSKLLIANTKYNDLSQKSIEKLDVQLVLTPALDLDSLLKQTYDNSPLSGSCSSEDEPAVIFHSSGSTSLPKPIYLSNRHLFYLATSLHVWIAETDGVKPLCDKDTVLACVPLFHTFGFFGLFSTVFVGGSMVFMEKLSTSQTEIKYAFDNNQITVMLAPPLIFEQMIDPLTNGSGWDALKKLRFAFYGGANLKKESGELLRQQGINVCNAYGATEVGCGLVSDLSPQGIAWHSLKPFLKDENGKYYAIFEDDNPSDPTFKHLYFRKGSPNLANDVSNRPDGGFDTNDLFKENLEAPGYYQYVGRRDDLLIMENGEKTNPLPIEAILRQSPLIKQAAILGHGRQCAAALVELDTQVAFDYSPDEIIDRVQLAVKEANAQCSNHSILLKQMVKILPFSKSLPSTDKCTVKRKMVEKMYNEEIEALYRDFLSGLSAKDDVDGSCDGTSWTTQQTQQFLAKCIAEILDINIDRLEDYNQSVFDLGLDSLKSIQLRNHIIEHFDNVPQNFVYQYSTINAMCDSLLKASTRDSNQLVEEQYKRTEEIIKTYIERANTDFPTSCNQHNRQAEDQVVLLTGATGSLGSFVLLNLLNNTSVKKIYCCIRGEKDKLRQRLVDSFKTRLLDTSVLDTDRLVVLPMNFKEPYLGFGCELYNKLKLEVSAIQYCAWKLDFNLPVEHYDSQCIAPFYQLLKFAYRQTNSMRVYFVSSVSASALASKGHFVVEEPLPKDSHASMPFGYAQSKFIVEKLLDFLHTEKQFPCYIERLGQICGDSRNGTWNTSEQFPIMFIGGAAIAKKMPRLDIDIDWISVDHAGAAIADILTQTVSEQSKEHNHVYHIVNPHRIKWSDLLDTMKKSGMSFEVVEMNEWIEAVSQDQSNPCYPLLSFYENIFSSYFEMPKWKTDKARPLTSALDQAPVISPDSFKKYLNYWKSIGFYDASQ